MEIKKCHVCSADIFPGEKRCMIAVHIFPDQEEDIFLDSYCDDEECAEDGCMDDVCGCAEEEPGEECFQEVHLVLCKDCQDQFMKNPLVKQSLFFLRTENDIKTLH